MKKFMIVLLALIMCMASMSFASAEKAGDTVTIPITLSNNSAAYVKATVSYDSSAFELVSLTSKGQVSGTTFNVADLGGVSGQVASITLRVTENAEPGKTYSITAKVVEAWTADETAASVSASGGSVTIDKPVEPTEEPTEKPTEAPTEKPTEKPTEAPTEKPTEAPTEKPTEAPTEKPTEAPTAKPTKAPDADDDVPKTGNNYAGYVIASIGMMLALVYLVLRRVIRSK